MFINTVHTCSISPCHRKSQPGYDRHPWAAGTLAAAALAASGAALAGPPSCQSTLGPASVVGKPLSIRATLPAEENLVLVVGHRYLIEVDERGNDARVDVLDAANHAIATADHPERRTGTRRALVTASASALITVRVAGKEHKITGGTATVRAHDLANLRERPDCLRMFEALSQADGDYARAVAMLSGGVKGGAASARGAFLQAAAGYADTERQLATTGDHRLRGETALALAGVEYFNLQDWAQAAQWARTAAELLGDEDPYRRARAQALEAAAWIELGPSVAISTGPGATGSGHHRSAHVSSSRRSRSFTCGAGRPTTLRCRWRTSP